MSRKRSSRLGAEEAASDVAVEPLALFRAWFEQTMRSGTGRLLDWDRTQSALGLALSRLLLDQDPRLVVEEWANPIVRMVNLLCGTAMELDVFIAKNTKLAPAVREKCKALAQQLDFALNFIQRTINPSVRFRSRTTHCVDLLLDALGIVEGDAAEAAALIERIQKDHPEVDRLHDGRLDAENTIDRFAWDTYQRVEELDRLVDRYPEHARWAARQMQAWPTLRSRHHSNDFRFRELAERLELGRDYPLDASEAARFRPDTPMVRLLDPLLVRLTHLRNVAKRSTGQFKMTPSTLSGHWWNHFDAKPTEPEIKALRRLARLPPLTKKNAKRWAKEVVVPVILATHDDNQRRSEPALRNILQQRGVKSAATFRSRLEAAVSSYLGRMARKG